MCSRDRGGRREGTKPRLRYHTAASSPKGLKKYQHLINTTKLTIVPPFSYLFKKFRDAGAQEFCANTFKPSVRSFRKISLWLHSGWTWFSKSIIKGIVIPDLVKWSSILRVFLWEEEKAFLFNDLEAKEILLDEIYREKKVECDSNEIWIRRRLHSNPREEGAGYYRL
jgi:hypothetical protein